MTRRPDAFTLISAAVGGLAIWFFFNGRLNLNRGWLAEASWPWNSPLTFVLAAAILAMGNAIVRFARSKRRAEEVHSVAHSLDLDVAETVERPQAPSLPLFDEWHQAENGLTGNHKDQRVDVFDLTTLHHDAEGGSRQQTWTVVLFRNVALPEFECLPRTWRTLPVRALSPAVIFSEDLADPVDRETVQKFNARYQVQPLKPLESPPEAEGPLRTLFHTRVLELLAERPGRRIQSANACLAVASEEFASAEERMRLWDDAVEVRRGLLSPADGGAVIPVDPRLSLPLQRRRMAGRAIGGTLGGVIGFFGGFILFAMLLFASPPGGPRPLMDVFFPFIFGGLAMGAVLGAIGGGWWAEWTYDPQPPTVRTPPPRGTGPLTVVGAMAGWMLGGVCGVATLLVVMPIWNLEWLAPALMFGPGLIGLFLGGYLGFQLAHWRAARKAASGADSPHTMDRE